MREFAWQAATTLAERLAASGLRADPARSRRGALRWRAERRADIVRVGQAPALAFDRPEWLLRFRSAYVSARQQPPIARSAHGFLTVVEPLLGQARRRVGAVLRRQVAGLCPGSKDARSALLASLELHLRERLLRALSKTLVLELAVARRRNILAGGNARERFDFFCDCLSDPGFARALLEQYPVLVRCLATMVGHWEAGSCAMLSRLGKAQGALHGAFFGGRDPGALVFAEAKGDTHRGGRAVHILQFESGARLVYKPRPVALERCFFGLIGWLNRNGYEPALKQVVVLDEGNFGWMEFIETKPCGTREELDRFFTRQGAQIALSYVLGGTDFHSENVIASGEHPVLVDLETLFQTPLQPKGLTGATAAGWNFLQTSVMGSLLLPEPLFISDDDHWIDVSALGHSDGQLTPGRVAVWSGDGTDRMRLSHKRMPLATNPSLPEYQSRPEPASRNVEPVVRGFESMYRLLSDRKNDLLSATGPLSGALGQPARRLIRNTNWYVQLIDDSHHPRHLADAIDLEAFLHNHLRAAEQPWRTGLEDLEVADLMAGDVPYFASPVGEPSWLTAAEAQDLADSRNGWEECRTRLRALSDSDLDQQRWLVRVAMADLDIKPEYAARVRCTPSRDPSADALIDCADRIGDRLCELAIVDGERATWLVPTIATKNRLRATVAGIDLYSGLSGIALFLGQLGAITGNLRHLRLAAAAMEEALARHASLDDAQQYVGAYDGVGGLAYALLHLASPLVRREWIGEATDLVRRVASSVTDSAHIDLISGQAGFLTTALALQRHTGDAALLRCLRPLARVLRRAAVSRRGESRLPPAADTGLAHGRAGIGLALSSWAAATGDDDFRTVAAELIRFDLNAVDSRRLHTPELNADRQQLGFDLGWCRGWLGSALAALRFNHAAPHAPHETDRLRSIADELIAFDCRGPLCLCHGALAHLDFMTAAEERGLVGDRAAAAVWRNRLLARLTGGEWVSDTSHRLEAPGLMLGLAGTGYSLLRVARPHLPSVLTLDPP